MVCWLRACTCICGWRSMVASTALGQSEVGFACTSNIVSVMLYDVGAWGIRDVTGPLQHAVVTGCAPFRLSALNPYYGYSTTS
jgi:hypothetical protein